MKNFLKNSIIACIILTTSACQTLPESKEVPTTFPDRPQQIIYCGPYPIPIFLENSVTVDYRQFEVIRCLLTDLTRYYRESEAIFDSLEKDF